MEAKDIRDEAKKIVDALPSNATWEDLIHQFCGCEAIESGLADSEARWTVGVDTLRAQYGLPK